MRIVGKWQTNRNVCKLLFSFLWGVNHLVGGKSSLDIPLFRIITPPLITFAVHIGLSLLHSGSCIQDVLGWLGKYLEDGIGDEKYTLYLLLLGVYSQQI